MPKISKVIFFTDTSFIERDYDRFGVETLQNNGFEVEIWDFTPFLHPQFYQVVKAVDSIHYKGYRRFVSQAEALLAISELTSNCFGVCFIGYSYYSLQIYRAFAKNDLKYAVYSSVLPSVLYKADNLTRLLHKLKKLMAVNSLMVYVRAQLRGILHHIPYTYVGVKPATLVLAGGEKYDAYRVYPFEAQTEVVWIHNWDYDFYLTEVQQSVETDPKMGVFLDQFVPFHPDAVLLGIAPNISAEEYYSALCRFFSSLEENYGYKIIIAAHPRSDYEQRPDYFGGRPVIKGKTIELCRKAKFSMLHYSTAINFAVLFNKPAIFITMDKLQQNPPDRTWIETMASSLGKGIININNLTSINWDEELKINEEAYRQYRNFYIKKDGSAELPIWQIFADRLKNF